jgi:hypothetical protein
LEPFAVNENFTKVDIDSEDAALLVQFDWHAGIAQICLLAATLLKVVDILINVVLPTPTITRNHQEQVDYEWRYGQVVDIDDGPNADCLRARKATSERSSRMENDDKPNDDEADCLIAHQATFECSSRMENDDEPNYIKADCLRARKGTSECSPRMENDNEPYDDEARLSQSLST